MSGNKKDDLQSSDPRRIGANRTTKEQDEKERVHEDLATRKDKRQTGDPAKPHERNFI
ncbi:hypothetical protein ACWNS2_06075 [Planococcus plakortidis]|uniref:hypothetical protein n=1 Tax=Planococcus plakortidis TaxID=1038856 RepID=UPI00385E44E2